MELPPWLKRCTKCKRIKDVEAFSPVAGKPQRRASRCKMCRRIAAAEYRQTEAYRENLQEYLAREDVRVKQRESLRAFRRRHPEKMNPYRSTPRGKLRDARYGAVYRLKRATTEAQRKRLKALIAALDREIAKLDAAWHLPDRRRPEAVPAAPKS